MKYAVEMGSGAMIYIISLKMSDSGNQILLWGFTDTQTARISHKPALGM
jgi:hypothetical protein